MHEVFISPSNPPSGSAPLGSREHYLMVINDAIVAAKMQRVRVYKTYVREFVFVTASKDLHLYLGTLSGTVQLCLANFLKIEFEANKCSELLLFRSSERVEGVLVTQSFSDTRKMTVFHLAVAH